jgi:CelD/BcsL family acetyltransferase involved in cellulose biosynthesis
MSQDRFSRGTVAIVDTLDETVWREFVDLHPQGNIFQTPEMFQVFLRAKGYQPELQAAVSETGQVLALLAPVQVALLDGPFRRLTARSIAYGSILNAPGVEGREALAILLRNYAQKAKREVLFTELRHLSDLSANQPVFAQTRFTYQNHLTYLVDLDCSTEELFNRLGARTRKHIRRELNRGEIVVEEVNDCARVETWYQVTKKSYTAAHVPLADISLFEAAFEILHPANMIKFWLARIGEDYVASSLELLYKDIIYGWYGGVDRAFSRFTPNEVLTWHILKWGAENGYRIYDFGGAGNPDEEYGVRDFKAKFGGRLVCYGRNTCIHSPSLFHLSTLGYDLLRHVISV